MTNEKIQISNKFQTRNIQNRFRIDSQVICNLVIVLYLKFGI